MGGRTRRRSSRRPSTSRGGAIERDPLQSAGGLLDAARADNEIGDFASAAARLDRALGLLAGRDDRDARWLRVRVRITRAWSELEADGIQPALRTLHAARTEALELDDPLLVALTHIQEGTLHGRVGAWPSCVEALLAVDVEGSGLDPAQRWAYHLNLGQAWLGVGRSADAAANFDAARDIAVEGGFRELEFKARHNRAVVAFVDGDLPRALTLMREADAMDVAVARDRARLDHAEVLLAAGLVDGARAELEAALSTAHSSGHRLEEGEISLRLARCDLLVGDLDRARDRVRDATAAYRTRQAHELVREAELLRAGVDVAEGRDLPAVVERLVRHTEHAAGEPGAPALGSSGREAVRLEAEARLLLGDADGAERRLADLGTAGEPSLAATLHEVLVRARLDLARDRGARASERLEEGNRVLAAHQFQSASLDVRAALALHGRRLAALDTERSLAGDRAEQVLATVERWRAISHRINPVTAPADPDLADATRELRRLRQLLADSDRDQAAALAPRVERLESLVAQREWSLAVDGQAAGAVHPVDADEATAALDGATTVVEFFESGGELHQVVLRTTGAEVVHVGPVPAVVEAVTRLRRDLRARATIAPGSPMAAVLERATTSSLAAADALLNPGGADEDRVVVVPSRTLAGMPWSLMPSLRGRPVTVAPSLTRWVRGPARASGLRPTTAVAALYGPGLTRTLPEIRAVERAWGVAPAPDPRTATSADVLDALGSARVVHLAAHGLHQGQSPLFSSVRMADGPVFAHEFPRPVAAEHVALSACDVGQFSTRPGDEPLGLAIALLSLGATSVLAAVAPVADVVAHDAMVAHHRRIATGTDASQAWAEVVVEHPAAGVFCLYGSEWSATP
ncbi:CHAT domain-containing protein [Arthrobacter sp. NEB 688]|uniref:CHAT domain-containing protein n=1 Tax=Arthrobacter sp. NEB 688 TaxID=904039 RepID=UPI001565330B|nr:CHAT domain-containing protein [Arthrobacter sp. NEB 688]QKE82932.1 CHAT domain-containing protein [Arthrobacter sp. NEB 688]